MADDEGTAGETATVLMRNYLSTHHLYAARFAAESAFPLEEGRVRMPFFVRHRGHVLTAITESVCFLEAVINEIYQDAADGHRFYIEPLGEDCLSRLSATWKATNSGQRLDLQGKYNLALTLAGAAALDEGASPSQEVAVLRRLRNYVVHYKPHDIVASDGSKLGDQLLQRGISGNRQFSDNPWFPDQALSAGCAEWCWRSARAFTDEFARRLNLSLNYQAADFGDPLPE